MTVKTHYVWMCCGVAGWDEIIRLKDRLESSPAFGSGRYQARPAGFPALMPDWLGAALAQAVARHAIKPA